MHFDTKCKSTTKNTKCPFCLLVSPCIRSSYMDSLCTLFILKVFFKYHALANISRILQTSKDAFVSQYLCFNKDGFSSIKISLLVFNVKIQNKTFWIIKTTQVDQGKGLVKYSIIISSVFTLNKIKEIFDPQLAARISRSNLLSLRSQNLRSQNLRISGSQIKDLKISESQITDQLSLIADH